jgi:hypothetical protein
MVLLRRSMRNRLDSQEGSDVDTGVAADTDLRTVCAQNGRIMVIAHIPERAAHLTRKRF